MQLKCERICVVPENWPQDLADPRKEVPHGGIGNSDSSSDKVPGSRLAMLRFGSVLSLLYFSSCADIKLNNGVLMPQIAAGVALTGCRPHRACANGNQPQPLCRHVAVRQRDRHRLYQAGFCGWIPTHRYGRILSKSSWSRSGLARPSVAVSPCLTASQRCTCRFWYHNRLWRRSWPVASSGRTYSSLRKRFRAPRKPRLTARRSRCGTSRLI